METTVSRRHFYSATCRVGNFALTVSSNNRASAIYSAEQTVQAYIDCYKKTLVDEEFTIKGFNKWAQQNAWAI